MPCNVLDNAIKDMYYKGIMSEARMINPNKITEFNIANEELKKAAQDLYGVKDKGLPFTIVDEGPRKEITGSSYRRDNVGNVLRAEPNMPFFKELQSNYDSIENETARLEYEEENILSTNEVKPGVQELFDSNPELASIGTQEQYSQYINSIFPDSKVKDIVYHGSNQKINQFEVKKEPLIHFGSKNAALQRGDVLNQVVLNIKDLQTVKDGMWFLGTDKGGLLKELFDRNILTFEQVKSINEAKNKAIQQSPYFSENYRMALPEGEKAGNKKLQEILKDKNIGFKYVNFSEDKNSISFAVPSQEQIHILGNEQDIEGFKKFVEKVDQNVTEENEYNTSDYEAIQDFEKLIELREVTQFCSR